MYYQVLMKDFGVEGNVVSLNVDIVSLNGCGEFVVKV